MGANAQTSVPSFSAGEILTAANMNISARTGIPVFATSTTRDAAFGGTGEKTLAEGQFAYLEDSNTTQYYDGAAWQSVGVAPGIKFITGASFTSVTTITFPNDTFTSTYDFYKCLFFIPKSTAGSSTLSLQLRDNSGTLSAASYYWALNGFRSDNVEDNISTAGGTSAGIGTCSDGNSFFQIDLCKPADSSVYTTFTQLSYAQDRGRAGGGQYFVNTAATGLVITATVAVTGNYKVYGMVNS